LNIGHNDRALRFQNLLREIAAALTDPRSSLAFVDVPTGGVVELSRGAVEQSDRRCRGIRQKNVDFLEQKMKDGVQVQRRGDRSVDLAQCFDALEMTLALFVEPGVLDR
jgi:hypothetical protein